MKILFVAFISLIILAYGTYAYSLPRYTITDLGTYANPNGAGGAQAVNDKEQVVGLYAPDTGDTPYYPFLWENGSMQKIGRFQGRANSINNNGVVVGATNDMSRTGPGFLYSNHQIHLLKTLGGAYSEAWSINTANVIVGISSVKENDDIGDEILHAVLWQDGHLYDLHKLGIVLANGINDKGEVVGCIIVKHEDFPMLLKGKTIKRLSLLKKFAAATPNAINNEAEIVGEAELNVKRDEDGARPIHAVIWFNGKMHDLGVLSGMNSTASAVKNAGQIVGRADTRVKVDEGWPITHAILWENMELYDLNKRISRHSGWVLYSAHGINNFGQIVGDGNHNGNDRAFMLTPIKK